MRFPDVILESPASVVWLRIAADRASPMRGRLVEGFKVFLPLFLLDKQSSVCRAARYGTSVRVKVVGNVFPADISDHSHHDTVGLYLTSKLSDSSRFFSAELESSMDT